MDYKWEYCITLYKAVSCPEVDYLMFEPPNAINTEFMVVNRVPPINLKASNRRLSRQLRGSLPRLWFKMLNDLALLHRGVKGLRAVRSVREVLMPLLLKKK